LSTPTSTASATSSTFAASTITGSGSSSSSIGAHCVSETVVCLYLNSPLHSFRIIWTIG
jgi:hypothetical protein